MLVIYRSFPYPTWWYWFGHEVARGLIPHKRRLLEDILHARACTRDIGSCSRRHPQVALCSPLFQDAIKERCITSIWCSTKSYCALRLIVIRMHVNVATDAKISSNPTPYWYRKTFPTSLAYISRRDLRLFYIVNVYFLLMASVHAAIGRTSTYRYCSATQTRSRMLPLIY